MELICASTVEAYNVFFLDGNQRIVFSPDPAEIGKDVSKEADIQQLLQGQNTRIRFRRETVENIPLLP